MKKLNLIERLISFFFIFIACSGTVYSAQSNIGKVPPKPISPAKVQRIVIDPGHGGADFGTHSVNPIKHHEKYLTLSTAMMLNNMLHEMGYHTTMTRNDDTFISLQDRAKLANDQKATLFVSIHYNSAPSREAEGIEIFYYDAEKDEKRKNNSKKLANSVLDKILEQTKAKSRGVKHASFLVIRETTMPAILIEGGFLTNSNEMDKIKNAAYLKKIAQGIAQGIHSYLSHKPAVKP